jgi:large subunit ribosomal protein L10
MPPRPSLAALRGYATAAAPKAAGKAPAAAAPAWTSPSAEANAPRIYTERKAFLYDYYTHLMQRSQLVLLFKHENLTVPTSGQLRAAIAKIPVPRPASVPAEQKLEKATLTVTRTGILAPVVRAVRPNADFSPLLDGPTAVITCPSLSPKYVKAMLGAVERVMKAAQKDEDPKKGPVAQPAFTLLAGVIEGNTLLNPAQVADAAKLPELDQLRSQLIGLLETPQRQLLGVVQQAGGGSLVRTLQGLEEGLKEKEGGAAPSP